ETRLEDAYMAHRAYVNEISQQPSATRHEILRLPDGTLTSKPILPKQAPSGHKRHLLQTEGHGYGPNPKNDGHHYGELCHEYAELLANNTRTVNGALRLYHIAMNGTCNNYNSSLIQGR